MNLVSNPQVLAPQTKTLLEYHHEGFEQYADIRKLLAVFREYSTLHIVLLHSYGLCLHNA